MTIQQQIETLQQQLRYPFPADAIHWRVGSTNSDKTRGLALAYLDARDVMDRLDETFGVSGWQSRFSETAKGRIICELSCRFPAEQNPEGTWITKSDGAGDTDYEGEKGAISDALKRAAVSYGIGRYLYRLSATWVETEQRGKSVYIKKGCEPRLPATALPEGTNSTTLPPTPSPIEEVTRRLVREDKDLVKVWSLEPLKSEGAALRAVASLVDIVMHEVMPNGWDDDINLYKSTRQKMNEVIDQRAEKE